MKVENKLIDWMKDFHDFGNLHIARARVADLVAEHSGWRIGLDICSQGVLVVVVVVVATAAAVVRAVHVEALVALGAEIAAAVEGAQCPILPPSPTFPAFSRNQVALWPSTSGRRLSSACSSP